jgi:hypothetical protein
MGGKKLEVGPKMEGTWLLAVRNWMAQQHHGIFQFVPVRIIGANSVSNILPIEPNLQLKAVPRRWQRIERSP